VLDRVNEKVAKVGAWEEKDWLGGATLSRGDARWRTKEGGFKILHQQFR